MSMSTEVVPTANAGRQRVTTACTSCRTKRIRCDGVNPLCGACLKSGRECEYPRGEEKRKPPSKKYVQALIARIDVLERELEHYRPERQHSTAAQSPVMQPVVSVPSPSSSTNVDPERDLSDLLGQLSVADDGQVTYRGPRSNFFVTENSTMPVFPMPPRKVPKVIPRAKIGLTASTQDHLLELYWTWQHPWMYFVHKGRFLQEFSLPGGNYCSTLLLLSILALASRFSDCIEVRTDPGDSNTAGDALAERARLLLSQEIESPSVSTVAAALILAVREMAVNKEFLGWTYAGIASRISFHLGLHLNCSNLVLVGQISQEDAEIRNITWWGNYQLDKLMNVGLGRPGTTPERDILAPLPSLLHNEEFYEWLPHGNDDNLAPQTSYSISSVQQTCKIFLLSSEPLDAISAPNSKLTAGEREHLVTKTYIKLATFYNNLPSCVRLPASAKKPLPPHIYLMHIQYFTAVIQLHRPFIRRPSKSPFGDLPENSNYTHNSACKSSAESITNILQAYKAHYTLRRIPISVIHCIGTGSVIHLFNAASDDPIEQRRAMRLLRFNFAALQDMNVAFQQWSKRTMRTLQFLAKKWAVSDAFIGPSTPLVNQSSGLEPGPVQIAPSEEYFRSTAANSDSLSTTAIGGINDAGNMDRLFPYNAIDDWSEDTLQINGLDYSLWDFDDPDYGLGAF